MNEKELREEITSLLKRDVFMSYAFVEKIKAAIQKMPVEALNNVLVILKDASLKQNDMFETLLADDSTLLFGLNKKLSKF